MNEPQTLPRVFADFHNSDTQGRVRLNCVGTVKDFARLGIVLHEGTRLLLDSYDLEAEGVVTFSSTESLWVATIDWNEIRECSKNPINSNLSHDS